MSAHSSQAAIEIRRPSTVDCDATVELHWGASWVRSKIPQVPPEANSYLNELQHHVNGALIQFARIQCDRQRWLGPDDRFGDIAFVLTFLDIHFCIICLEKIENLSQRLFREIAPLFQGATEDQVTAFRNVRHDFREALRGVNAARNFLEHIDARIRAGGSPTVFCEFDQDGLEIRCGDAPHPARLDVPSIDAAYDNLIRLLLDMPDVV